MGKWAAGTLPHGTNARYHRHLRENEEACVLCRQAHAKYERWRKLEQTKREEKQDE